MNLRVKERVSEREEEEEEEEERTLLTAQPFVTKDFFQVQEGEKSREKGSEKVREKREKKKRERERKDLYLVISLQS